MDKLNVGRSGAGAPSGCQPSASAPLCGGSSQSGIPNAADFALGYDLAIATLRDWAAGFVGGANAVNWLYAAARDLELNRTLVIAQAIEARRAATGTGAVEDESAVGNADAPNPDRVKS